MQKTKAWVPLSFPLLKSSAPLLLKLTTNQKETWTPVFPKVNWSWLVFQSFPRSVIHVAMSSKNWFGPVKGYSLLDQMTSRNLNTSSVEYVMGSFKLSFTQKQCTTFVKINYKSKRDLNTSVSQGKLKLIGHSVQ
jgi:hypothetical protein